MNNTKNYRPVPNDPTKINNATVNKTTNRFQKEHLIKDREHQKRKNTTFLYKAQNSQRRNHWSSSSVVQLIATTQKYQDMLITIYNQ